jgi:uncharacterized protein
MRFFADQTVGRLTKWLRFLGFDVAQTRLTPQEFPHLPTLKPDTYILTRQASLAAKLPRPDLIVLASDQPEAQLTEICRRLQISSETWEPLNRCSDCNQILVPVAPEQAEDRVPEYISRKHQQFFECPRCQRLFWEGSHQRRLRRRLQELQSQIDPF